MDTVFGKRFRVAQYCCLCGHFRNFDMLMKNTKYHNVSTTPKLIRNLNLIWEERSICYLCWKYTNEYKHDLIVNLSSCKSYRCICRIVNIKSIYWAVYEMFIMYELLCITVIWFLVSWSSKIVCHEAWTKRLSNCFIAILNSNSNERSQGLYPFGECIYHFFPHGVHFLA